MEISMLRFKQQFVISTEEVNHKHSLLSMQKGNRMQRNTDTVALLSLVVTDPQKLPQKSPKEHHHLYHLDNLIEFPE